MTQAGGLNTEDLILWVSVEENRINLLNYLSPDRPRLRDIFMKRLAMLAVVGLTISIIGMLSENHFSANYLSEKQIRQELSQGVN